jgi:hypothetical protein
VNPGDTVRERIPLVLRIWRGSSLKTIFAWRRVRTWLVLFTLVFILLRVALGLFLDYALDRATQGTLGLSCKVGRSALNLTAGEAVLTDVALVGSDGQAVISIGRADLDLSWFSLPNLIVRHLSVEDVDVHLKREADGRIPALATILKAPKPDAAPAPAVPVASAPPKSAAEDAPLPVVLLEKMRITHIRLLWDDETQKPPFKGELVLDARADEIATFSRPQPPSFSLRLASPGVLDSFRFDVAGRTLEDGVNAFDFVLGAEAHPRAIAAYLGNEVEVTARTLALAFEGHAAARPTYLEGGRYFAGDFTLERAALKADDDELDLGRIVAIFSRLSRERIDVASVSIDRPRVSFGRLADGALRILGFGLHGKGSRPAETAEAAPPPPAGAPALLPTIHVGEVALHEGRFHFRDESTKTPVTIDADYQGRIQDFVVEREGNPGHRARVDASCSLPGIVEKMGLTGTFVPMGDQRDLSLDLSAEGIGLTEIAPYLKRAGFEPDLKRGSAHASFHALAVRTPEGTLGFSAELTKAVYADTDELMSLQGLRVEGGDVAKDGSVSLARISVEGPRLEVRRHRSGALSVGGIRTARGPVEAAPADAPDEPVAESAPAKKTRIAIGEIALTGGKIAWKDDALAKPVELALDAGTIELTGLTLGAPEAAPASLRASAKLLPSIGEASIEASLMPDPGAPEISGTLTARDVSMKALASYLNAYSIDPTLERGRLEAGLYLKARFKGPALANAHVLLAPVSVKTGVDELGAIDSIDLDGMSIQPAIQETNLGNLTITAMRGRASRDAQGALRFLGFRLNPAPAGALPAEEAPVASAAAPAPRPARASVLRMGTVALKGASFSWHDELVQPPADVRLESLDVTLGPRRLDRDPRPGEPLVPLRVHAEVDRVATLDLDAGVAFGARTPGISGDLKVSALTLAAVAPYLSPAGYQPKLEKGSFEGHFDAQVTLDQGITGAKLDLSRVRYADGPDELFGLDHARIPFELDQIANSFHVGELLLEGPRLVASKTVDGDLLAGGLLMKKKADDATPPPAPAPLKGAKAPPPLAFSMDSFTVTGLALDWRDDSLQGAHVAMDKGSFELGPFRPGKKLVTPFKLHADCGNLGQLSFEGICAIATRTSCEADLELSAMNGREISPYLGEGTSLDLDQGRLAFKLSYSSEPAPSGGQKMLATISSFGLAEKGKPLFGWDLLTFDIGRSDPAHQVYVVNDAALVNLRGEIVKLPGGRSRAFGFDLRPVAAAPAPKSAPKKQPLGDAPPLPSVELDHFAIGASRITIHDLSEPMGPPPPRFSIENVVLTSTAPFVLVSEDPTTAVLDLALTAGSGGTFEEATATVHAIPFDAEPTARIELDLRGLQGDAIMKKSPGLAAHDDFSAMKGGVAHLGINFTVKSHERLDRVTLSPAPFAFELALDSFSVKSSPDGPVLLGLDDFLLDVPSYDLKTGEMHARKLELANPVGTFAKEPGGFRALDILFKNPPPPKPGTPVSNEPPAPKPAAAPSPPYKVDRIVVSDGAFAYVDSTVSPVANLHAEAFEVDILGFSSDWRTQRRPMNISIRSRGGSYDDFKIKGQLAFAPRLEGDFTARILGLQLEKLSGYSELDPNLKLKMAGGKLDLEMIGSFKKGNLKADARVTILQPDFEDLEGGYHIATALDTLADMDNVVQLEVPVELELDQNWKVVGDVKISIGKILRDAVSKAFGHVAGSVLNALTQRKIQVAAKTDQSARKRPPIAFGPVETRLPSSATVELDELAEHLRNEPLFFVNLRGVIGNDDARRARELASPPAADRRDLISRLEGERAHLERQRSDAMALVRGSLQAGTNDAGAGRAQLVEVTALIQKVDRSLDSLYEQEREGAERGAERRTHEIETTLCNDRVEAVSAYLINHGAPGNHVKVIPPRLKPIEQDAGVVAVEAFMARRASLDKAAVEQKPK